MTTFFYPIDHLKPPLLHHPDLISFLSTSSGYPSHLKPFLLHHPDLISFLSTISGLLPLCPTPSPNQPDKLAADANAQFQELGHAYEVFSDPKERACGDRWRWRRVVVLRGWKRKNSCQYEFYKPASVSELYVGDSESFPVVIQVANMSSYDLNRTHEISFFVKRSRFPSPV